MDTNQATSHERRPGPAAAPLRSEHGALAKLLDRYYEGPCYGNTGLLGQVFQAAATYATASGGALHRHDLADYLPVVAKPNSPASLGEPYGFELESIEFVGPTAAPVKMRSSTLSQRFMDVLSLPDIDGEWCILAKVLHDDNDASAQGD